MTNAMSQNEWLVDIINHLNYIKNSLYMKSTILIIPSRYNKNECIKTIQKDYPIIEDNNDDTIVIFLRHWLYY